MLVITEPGDRAANGTPGQYVVTHGEYSLLRFAGAHSCIECEV